MLLLLLIAFYIAPFSALEQTHCVRVLLYFFLPSGDAYMSSDVG